MHGRGADQRRAGDRDGRGRTLSAGEGSVEVRPGRQIAWAAVGAGLPLLLLNGYAATGADWDPSFVGTLAAHHRVICPDNIGLGSSSLAEEEEVGGVAGMTADAITLMDGLGIDRAAVVGWSMGGFVAQSLVRAAPDRVAALALISTSAGGPDAIDAVPGVFERLIDHSGTPREQATRLLSLLFPPDRAADADARFGELVAAARERLPERVLFEQEDALVQWGQRPEPLDPIGPGRPTVVIHGGQDAVFPPGNAAVNAGVHPGAEIRIFEDCAHAPMGQEPEAVAEAILAVSTDA